MSNASREYGPATIVRARLADWDELEAFIRSCGLPTEGLHDHLDTTLIARVQNVVAGASAVEVYPHSVGILRSVAVAKQLRGRGLGLTMVMRSLALARERKLAEILLLTDTAESFFAQFGFETIPRDSVPHGIETTTEFVLDRCRSATVMRLILRKEASPDLDPTT
jgi:amino-acid N-acetyltransferase